VVAAFASPRLRSTRQSRHSGKRELPVRMGLRLARQLRDGDYFGTVLNRAARVQLRAVSPPPMTMCPCPGCAFEDERHAVCGPLEPVRSGTAQVCAGHRVGVGRLSIVLSSRGAAWPGPAHQPHTAGCLQLHRQTAGSDTMQTDAHTWAAKSARAA